MASLILISSLFLCTALAPNLNFRHFIQLELSVKTTSLKIPTPPFRVIVSSPVTSGRLPSLSRISLDLNSFSDQSSWSSEQKSPSRTTISIFIEERGPEFTTVLLYASIKFILTGPPSSASILLQVKIERGSLLTKTNRKRLLSDVSAWSTKFLHKS